MFPESMPLFLQIVLVAAGVLAAREGFSILWKHLAGKKKTSAEIDGIHLSNHATALDEIKEMMDLVSKLRKETEADQAIIRAFKDDKIADRDKINRRDGVIEEQRKEIRDLHQELAEMRVREKDKDERITVLERKVREIERQNEEIVKENFQLKGREQQGAK